MLSPKSLSLLSKIDRTLPVKSLSPWINLPSLHHILLLNSFLHEIRTYPPVTKPPASLSNLKAHTLSRCLRQHQVSPLQRAQQGRWWPVILLLLSPNLAYGQTAIFTSSRILQLCKDLQDSGKCQEMEPFTNRRQQALKALCIYKPKTQLPHLLTDAWNCFKEKQQLSSHNYRNFWRPWMN